MSTEEAMDRIGEILDAWYEGKYAPYVALYEISRIRGEYEATK